MNNNISQSLWITLDRKTRNENVSLSAVHVYHSLYNNIVDGHENMYGQSSEKIS